MIDKKLLSILVCPVSKGHRASEGQPVRKENKGHKVRAAQPLSLWLGLVVVVARLLAAGGTRPRLVSRTRLLQSTLRNLCPLT